MSRIKVSAGCALVCARLLVLGTSGWAQQANTAAMPQPILPAAPTELLACLPPAPAGWTMTRSNAASSFTQWVTTIANRELKQNPPFVVEIRGKNMLEEDLLDSLAQVDYQRLLAIPDTGPHEVPQPVTLTRVDELHPAQNRTYPLYWAQAGQR